MPFSNKFNREKEDYRVKYSPSGFYKDFDFLDFFNVCITHLFDDL